jgi:hypothetical protein
LPGRKICGRFLETECGSFVSLRCLTRMYTLCMKHFAPFFSIQRNVRLNFCSTSPIRTDILP